ncbi:MAG: four helix bundle protein [Dehalococcoidia bacterium]
MCAEPQKFIRSYDDLDVFQRSVNVLKTVHDLAARFPDYEKFDLASQMRRAAKSIPANIAEGYAKRRSAKEFRAYLSNALGSATEMQVHLKIARKLEYIGDAKFEELIEEYRIIARQLYRLIQHWRTYESLPPPSDFQEPPT